MNIKKNIKDTLFYIFSKKRFNLIFLLILILLFGYILYNNNNLIIEGNKNKSLIENQKDVFNNDINLGEQKYINYKRKGNKQNKKGEELIKETFIESMSCENNNYLNYDNKNSTSNLVTNVCNKTKKMGQEQGVLKS